MQVVSRALLLLLLLLLGLSALLHAARSVRPRRKSQAKGGRVKLDPDPPAWPEISGTSLANRSLSPWAYKVSSEESRFPRVIYHAQCLTSGCLSSHGEGEDASLEAKPLYYQMLVLYRVPMRRKANKKKGGSEKRFQLQLRTEVVSVGCTCVKPIVVTEP